ncbi:GNAT family N-acetyltransferase [Flavobacterium sp. RHBU_24]|uniref:GNAT family N-acetyltransferase n=1 Tax=Flavobacterium sp. RHBU_24 TaxID=3391185 RepID=UPI00398564CB
MYTIERYNKDYFADWNTFVKDSKNGTFLFDRNFMEYHSDRFDDFSVLIFEGKKLMAVFPAHVKNGTVYSHLGLTYGGLALDFKIYLHETVTLVKELLSYYNSQGIEKLYIKTIPFIYHKAPSQEQEYCMFLTDAKLVRRDSVSVIENSAGVKFNKSRIEAIRKSTRNGLVISEDNNLELFWNGLLIPNLQQRYAAAPVHTLAEIMLLKELFPNNIRHFNVYHEGKLVAGSTVFVTDTVAKPQYISGDDERNALGSLDFLYDYLITDAFKHKKFFDFGCSNVQQGRKLNSGVSFWKESYGARTIAHDFYEVATANHTLLDNVLI